MTLLRSLAALGFGAAVLFGQLSGHLAASEAAVTAPPADRSSFHVFILMGQSNMAGSAFPILAEDATPSDRVLAMDKDLAWHRASSPLEASRGGGSSPGQSFARHYAELHPGVTVGLINCARGGRSLKELAKGGTDRDGSPNYEQSLKRITAAAAQGTLKGLLWHQGESDAGDAAYVDRLAKLAADLRADLGTPDLPMVAGELGRYMAWTVGFNRNIPRAAQIIPHCAVASAEGYMHLGDGVHFSGFSAETMGGRYLLEWLRLAEPALAPRWEAQLAPLTAAMAKRDASWDLLLNGDMSEGTARPFAWDGTWIGKGALAVVRDTAEPASGAPSLRISSDGGQAQGSISQILRDVAGKSLRVTVRARNRGFGSLKIGLYGNDSSWKACFQQEVGDATGATEWREFSAEVAVPVAAVNTRLAFGVGGEGSAWIDDVRIERIAAPPAASASELAVNGAMTAGDAAPTGWSGTWAGKGKITAVRDTDISRGGPASLRISSDGGPAKGAVGQELAGAPGKRIHASGWVRSDGKAVPSAAIAVFDANWKVIAWHAMPQAAAAPAGQWTEISVDADIPANAARANFSVGIEGEGSAWFDDLSAQTR